MQIRRWKRACRHGGSGENCVVRSKRARVDQSPRKPSAGERAKAAPRTHSHRLRPAHVHTRISSAELRRMTPSCRARPARAAHWRGKNVLMPRPASTSARHAGMYSAAQGGLSAVCAHVARGDGRHPTAVAGEEGAGQPSKASPHPSSALRTPTIGNRGDAMATRRSSKSACRARRPTTPDGAPTSMLPPRPRTRAAHGGAPPSRALFESRLRPHRAGDGDGRYAHQRAAASTIIIISDPPRRHLARRRRRRSTRRRRCRPTEVRARARRRRVRERAGAAARPRRRLADGARRRERRHVRRAGSVGADADGGAPRAGGERGGVPR